MEALKNLLRFGKCHSTSVVVTLLLTSYFGEGYDFILLASPKNPYSQLNRALLATSRAILALVLAFSIHRTFIQRSQKQTRATRVPSNTTASNTRDVLIDIACIATTFWVPAILLRSILVVLLFGCPFALNLYISLRLYHYFYPEDSAQTARLDSSNVSVTPETSRSPGIRTRSGRTIYSMNEEVEPAPKRLRCASRQSKQNSSPSRCPSITRGTPTNRGKRVATPVRRK